jgi:hypothetical protein
MLITHAVPAYTQGISSSILVLTRMALRKRKLKMCLVRNWP